MCAVCEFRSKVRRRTFGCVAMGSAVFYISKSYCSYILRSRLLVYSAGSGMNRVHVVLS